MTAISACRICGNTDLQEVMDLGSMALTGIFPRPGVEVPRAPLRLLRCAGGCGLVQLEETYELSKMYGDTYGYRSGLNKSMVMHLQYLIDGLTRSRSLGENDVVVDIGSNDGTALGFYPETVRRIGVDPSAEKFRHFYKPGIELIPDFFSAATLKPVLRGQKVDVVTSFAMFYDLEDPLQFMREVEGILSDTGIWLMEQSYLPAMLRANAFDTVCFKPETLVSGVDKPIGDCQPGDWVYGVTGEKTAVKATMRRRYDGVLHIVKPMYLEAITATPEHPLYVVKGNHVRYESGQLKPRDEQQFFPEWHDIREVEKGDFVAVPRLRPGGNCPAVLDLTPFHRDSRNRRRGLDTVELCDDLAWLIGLYVAEGFRISPRHGGLSFSLHEDEVDLVGRIRTTARRLGYKTRVTPAPHGGKGIEVKVSCSSLGRALHAWCGGGGARQKAIPSCIMQASNGVRKHFLRGLFAGDGYIKGNQVHLHTSSHQLALQTQLLIAALGGMVGITEAGPATSLKKDGSVISTGPSWQLRGRSPELAMIFGFVYTPGAYAANRHHVTRDFIFVPVSQVTTEQYTGEVCNIETGNHTYVVSNAVVHNCHEHIEYYSLRQIEWMAERAGLEVLAVRGSSTNGGSFIVALAKKDTSGTERIGVQRMRDQELHAGLGSPYVYDAFRWRCSAATVVLEEFLVETKRRGQLCCGLGASTKGNVVLQSLVDARDLIPSIGDVNPDKWGCVTPGTQIPIWSEDEVLGDDPDFLLVLPWHFRDNFINNPKYKGRRLVFPLPQLEIVQL